MDKRKWCVNYRNSLSKELVNNPKLKLEEHQKKLIVREFKCLEKHKYDIVELNYDLGYAVISINDLFDLVPYVRLRPTQLPAEEELSVEIEEEPLNEIVISKSDFVESNPECTLEAENELPVEVDESTVESEDGPTNNVTLSEGTLFRDYGTEGEQVIGETSSASMNIEINGEDNTQDDK